MTSRKKGAELSKKLQRSRTMAARAGKFRATRETAPTDVEYHVRAHEVLYECLNATRVKSEKIDSKALFLQRKSDPEGFAAALAQVREILDGRPFAILADKVLYLEAEGELRRRTAEMVVDRAYPLPNRTDSTQKSRYRILRIDPNKREATLEEIPAQAALPPDESF